MLLKKIDKIVYNILKLLIIFMPPDWWQSGFGGIPGLRPHGANQGHRRARREQHGGESKEQLHGGRPGGARSETGGLGLRPQRFHLGERRLAERAPLLA